MPVARSGRDKSVDLQPGAGRRAHGRQLCFSGSVTGSQCGLKDGVNTSMRSGKSLIRGMAEAYYSKGAPAQRCPQAGDSG
jgi:hypothetical protein